MGLIFESGSVEILYGFLLSFWFIYLYFVKDYGYWEERNIPHAPAVFPFGSISDVVLARCYMATPFDNMYKEFKEEPYVGYIEVRRPCLLVKDPDLLKLILQKDFHYFTDHHWFDVHPKDYMFNNLFNMKGQEWKEMRAKLTPAYTAAKMKMMFFLVKQCSDRLQEVLENVTDKNNVIDVKDILSRFSIDIIATCAFGLEAHSLSDENSDFYRIGKKALVLNYNMLFKMFVYNAFPLFSKLHVFDFTDPEITNFISNVIRTTVDYREKLNITRYDFLDLLIKLKQNQSILEEGEKLDDFYDLSRSGKREGLTIEEITSETFLFFTAGYETTSNTTLFCLYELACSCLIQDKLYWEIVDVLERHDGNISYQALQEMTYMDKVINEAMRRYPMFPFLVRTCTENYKLPNSNLVLEKDLKILIPVYSLHHDPKYYPDPFTFDPERFNEENSKKRHPLVYLPFGEGPRMCIGFRFGMMKVKSALATILSDYEVNLTPDTEVPLKMKKASFTTVPQKTLMLIFNRRQPKT